MADNAKVYDTPGAPRGGGQAEKVKVYEEKKKGMSLWMWLIPLLILLGILIWYFSRNHNPAPTASSMGSVYFDTGSAALTADDQTTLNKAADSMKQNPNMRLRIQGYTDSTGDAAQNVALSKQRSDAVQQYLTGKGVDQSRLNLEGFGDSNPAATNGTADGKATNRRVELFQQ